MSRSLTIAALLASLSSLPALAAPSGPLYVDDISGNVGTVNLATGQVAVLGNAGVVLTDIAFTANGDLYGTSFTDLYRLDRTTGAATAIGSYGAVGNGGMNALIGNGAGLLGTSTTASGLYSIQVNPFSVGSFTGTTAGASAGDLAFDAAGPTLYETLVDGSLQRLSLTGTTVSATTVGNMGRGDVFGLATGDDGITYAVAGTEIFSVNLATAALTPLFDYGGHGLGTAYGSAFIGEAKSGPASVPVPAPILLLGTSLLTFGGLRRRARR